LRLWVHIYSLIIEVIPFCTREYDLVSEFSLFQKIDPVSNFTSFLN